MGRYSAHLVGESNYQGAVKRLRDGDPIELVHEPDNAYDDRAIMAATSDGATVGYLQRGSWIGRVLIDEQKPVAARVHEIIGGGRGQMLGIILEILTATDAENPPDTPLPRLHGSREPARPTKRKGAMERAGIAALESAVKRSQLEKSTGCVVALVCTPLVASALKILFG